MVQELIVGKSVSASVYSTGNKSLAITLSKQILTLGSPYEESEYYGGLIPFDSKLKNKAMETAVNAVQAIKGLKGYVGVDMVLTDDQVVVIEINPRLTVSYIGLNKILNFNPAKALVDSVIKEKIPKNIEYKGYCFFKKVAIPYSTSLIHKIRDLKEIVSPPFPLKRKESSYALIATSSNTMKNAKSAFYTAKNYLLNDYNGD
jgi:predicted ATP-grasp superfamily ATP-dependent carboligase